MYLLSKLAYKARVCAELKKIRGILASVSDFICTRTEFIHASIEKCQVHFQAWRSLSQYFDGKYLSFECSSCSTLKSQFFQIY